MTKSEIKEKLWIMENFCNGKSANVGRNEVLGNDEQSDFYAEGIERKPYKGKEPILDKIRAEVKALNPEPTAYDVVDGNPIKDAVWKALADVLKIIDKYKAEMESEEARLANPTPEKYKMHPIKDGFPKTDSVRYLVQDADGRIWDAEYDENQENPEERFGEWAQRFDPSTLGAIDSEWDPYPDIVAWCERPELYEEESEGEE